ncbi:hypothetical protein Tsubulata_028251, partial [Turnera subulata]
MFGRLGLYSHMNYMFLFGLVALVPVWMVSRIYPEKKWINELHMLDQCRDFLQLCGVQEIQGVVGLAQLHPIGWIRCRGSILGHSTLFLLTNRQHQWTKLVGFGVIQSLSSSKLSYSVM